MTTRWRYAWAIIAVLSGPTGIIVGKLKLNLLGPNPGTFFTLGVLATLSLLGIAHGLREGWRSWQATASKV